MAVPRQRDTEQLRMRLTRDVLRMLRRREVRAMMPPPGPGRPAAILVSLPEDTVETLLEQVTQLGGSAHVVIPAAGVEAWPDGMAILHVSTADDRRPAPVQA